MRVMSVLVVCSLLIVSASLSIHGEPVAQPGISFALPFICGVFDSRSRKPDHARDRKSLCLADTVEAGRDVVLIAKTGICNAKTVSTFAYERSKGDTFEATHLIRTQECPEYVTIAVVGANPAAIRLIPPEDDHSVVTKDIELEARRLLESKQNPIDPSYRITNSPPEVLRVAHVTLLKFELTDVGDRKVGPAVLFADNQFFLLERRCTTDHLFFSINSKLHLAYLAKGCGSGAHIIYVYDISSGTPKQVYANGALSN